MIPGFSSEQTPVPPVPKPTTPPEPSIWGRLGQLAKDTGWAVAAGPRFAWDVVTAAGNDDEAYNGIRNTLTTASAQALGRVVKPLGTLTELPVVKPVIEKIDMANREVVREPVAALNLLTADRNNNLNDGAPLSWAEAYRQAQYVSVGQANYAATKGDRSEEFVNLDWNNPEEVKQFFDHGPQKTWSGAIDAAFQIFGDVTIVAGKAGKVLRASEMVTGGLTGAKSAEKITKAIQEVAVAEDGLEANKFTPLLDEFAANDALWAYNHPMLQNSPARSTLAYALGAAETSKDVGTVIRAGLGDPNALAEIRAVGRVDLANPIGKSLGELDSVDEWGLLGEKLENGSPRFTWESDAIDREVGSEIEALKINNSEFNKLWALQEVAATPGGVLTRTVGSSPFQAVDSFVAGGRSAKFYDLNATTLSKTTTFQPTPFHRMYQVVTWAAGERPAGIVNLNDAESSREVVATINRSMKVANIPDAYAREMADDYLSAATPEQRAEAVYKIESQIFSELAAKHGFTLEDANAIYGNYKRARATAYSSLKEKGYAVDLDGTVFKAPLYESQTANVLPMMDFDLANSVLRRHNLLNANSDLKQAMGWVLDGGSDAINGLDIMQSLFKVGSLMRLGYLVRNSFEAQLRIAASLGSLTSMRHIKSGTSNLIYNTGTVAKRTIDKMNPLSKTMSYEQYKLQGESIGTEIEGIQKRIAQIKRQIDYDRSTFSGDEVNGIPVSEFDDPSRLADLNIFETLLAEKQAMYAKTNEHLGNLEKGKRRMASGTYEYTGIDGTKYTLPEAYGGPYGDTHWDNASSENSYLSLVDREAKKLSGKMVDTGFGPVEPSDPNYWTEWAKTLNNQLGNSEVSRRLASGENLYKTVSWLQNSPTGRYLRGRLGLDKEDSLEYVLTAKRMLDEYLPNESLQAKLANREVITPSILREAFPETSTLPTVHGHKLAQNLSLVGQKKTKSIINSVFKFIGSMPEDAWARHPVYAELYKRSLGQRIDNFTAVNGRPVSQLPDDMLASSEMGLAMRAAHADALRGTKQLLFTIDRKTNLASYMKFISPFFSAFENSVKTWAKLAYEKPQLVTRANLLFTAPNRAGNAYDAEGNPVAPEDATMDDYIRIEIPESFKSIPFIGKGLASLDQLSVQKRSLDVIFQGGVELPVGPYVTIPVSEIVKNQPSYEESLKWAIPFGPTRNAVLALTPAWVRRQITRTGGQKDPQYANTYALIWQTEQHKRKAQGLPMLKEKEVQALTDAYYNMRTVANLILPFAPTFNSPYKFYIDQYRQYQEQYKKDAPVKFWETYGDDFFDFTMSLSKNNTGIGSSIDDVSNAKKYSDLVAEVSGINPKLVGLITSTGQGEYKFSQAAYLWQQQTAVSPSSDLTFRGRQSPQEGIEDTEISLGWIKYRKMVSLLDEVLKSRNLTSYQQKGAEDLQDYKEQTITQLGKQNNNWYDDYNSNQKNGYQDVIKTFKLALNDKKFMKDHGNDPTWKSIATFLDFRNSVAQALAVRQTKSIESKSNADLQEILGRVVLKLKSEDIGFSDIYDRYFSSDPVYDKVYTEVDK